MYAQGVDMLAILSAQVENLTKQLGKSQSSSSHPAIQPYICCDYCGEDHETFTCPFDNFHGQVQQRAYYEVPQDQLQQLPFNIEPQSQPPSTLSLLEQSLLKMDENTNAFMQERREALLEQSLLKMSETTNLFIQETRASLKRLETQIGQLAQAFQRSQSTLPSQTERSPQEDANVMEPMNEKEGYKLEEEEPNIEDGEWVGHSKVEEFKYVPLGNLKEDVLVKECITRYDDMVAVMKREEFNNHTYLSNAMEEKIWIMPWTND